MVFCMINYVLRDVLPIAGLFRERQIDLPDIYSKVGRGVAPCCWGQFLFDRRIEKYDAACIVGRPIGRELV